MIPIGHTETLVIGPSGSRKTNYLLNSIQKDNNIIDKIHLCAKKAIWMIFMRILRTIIEK